MRRGDLVTVAIQGDYGKPRPALVVQSDLFKDHPSVTVIPITSDLRDAPIFRVGIEPCEDNGLQKPSQAMVDKIMTLPREKCGPSFGRLRDTEMLEITRSLVVFLGVA